MIDIYKIHSGEVAGIQSGAPTVDEYEYLIPNGKHLSILRFSGGHEHAVSEVRTELIERDGETDTLIDVGYGQSFDKIVEIDFTGDGTKKIVIKHVNGDPGALHMTGKWAGRTDV